MVALRLNRLAIWLLAALSIALGACAPSVAPLYRDYELTTSEAPPADRIAAALTEAGWETVPASAENAVATEERTFNEWGLYQVKVSLEVIPVGEAYVRVMVHPYRKYITGSRSKIPFLRKNLQNALLKELNPAFERHGLRALDAPLERDRQTANR